uniref:Protein kinase domain-containing protein n=1 Tax=Arcella intermedia TaxID=1963864 RepID=A0A6B2KYM5_9EUKA
MGNNATSEGEMPYEMTDNAVITTPTGWELKNGWQIADKRPVSVFVYSIPSHAAPGDVEFYLNFLKRFKTMHHPNMLRLVTGLHSEAKKKIFVVTERVRPLEHVLTQVRNQENVLSWGIYEIMTAVSFINEKGITHGNVGIQSVFVNKHGDWKLGGFEFMTEHVLAKDKSGPFFYGIRNNLIPAHIFPPEITNTNYAFSALPPHSIDSWLTGCFLYALFSKGPFHERNQLKDVNSIPASLREAYMALIIANPAKRAKIEALQGSPFFQNPFVETCLFLENIQLKDQYEKERFFMKLTKLIDELPEDYCKYKILPHLVTAMDFGSGSSVLEPLLKLAKNLNEEEFTSEVAPSVVKWFKSTDQQIRINLLENFSVFGKYLPGTMVNEQVYPSVATGFLDPNPAVRELTLKAMPAIVPKMNVNNINNHLLRCLAKLQTDVEPKIRYQTTECISQIAEFLNVDTRNKVLVPAFTRSLRDTFPASRQAGLTGFINSAAHFGIRDIATRIVPAVSFMTIDPDVEVRAKAVQALQMFVKKIEEGQRTFSASYENQNQNSGQTAELAAAAESVLGWAFQAVSSKIIGGAESGTEQTSTTSYSSSNQYQSGHSTTLPQNTSTSISQSSYSSAPSVQSQGISSSSVSQPYASVSSGNTKGGAPVGGGGAPVSGGGGAGGASGVSGGGPAGSGRRLREPKEKPKPAVKKIESNWDEDDTPPTHSFGSQRDYKESEDTKGGRKQSDWGNEDFGGGWDDPVRIRKEEGSNPIGGMRILVEGGMTQ